MDAILIFLMWFGVPAALIFFFYLGVLLFNSLTARVELKDLGTQMHTDERPLFILKYQPWRIAWKLVFPYSIWLPICYAGFFYWGYRYIGFKFWFLKITTIIGLIGGVWLIFDMLLMQDICLYKDRIIKRYKFKKSKEVFLEKAKFDAMSNCFIAFKRIYSEDTPLFLRGFKGIAFDEHLSNPKDIRAFNETLAQISGRSVEDIEHMWSSKKIMQKKEDKS